MSDRLPCGLCGGSMSMLRNGATNRVSRDIIVCRHCDMPCRTYKCTACVSVGRAKNEM